MRNDCLFTWNKLLTKFRGKKNVCSVLFSGIHIFNILLKTKSFLVMDIFSVSLKCILPINIVKTMKTISAGMEKYSQTNIIWFCNILWFFTDGYGLRIYYKWYFRNAANSRKKLFLMILVYRAPPLSVHLYRTWLIRSVFQ